MRGQFISDINPTNHELVDLKKIITASHEAPWISASIDGLHASKTVKLCGILSNNSLASFAWYMQRNWIINDESYVGLSIGVVTTDPRFRNQGHAKTLISGIEELAKLRNIDFLYLAGIPGFYDKYGFTGFAPKSKLIFHKTNLPKSKGRVITATVDHLHIMSTLHNAYANAISSYCCRKSNEWEDLLGPLSSTFLFNNPKIILNENDIPIAYYCSSPKDATIIREFVPRLDSDAVRTALALIADSPEHAQQERIEIFTPAKGIIWKVAANSLGADFMCFLRPKASNMIKWISSTKSRKDFDCNFLLQGDLL
jgi:predicted acetyltransferase